MTQTLTQHRAEETTETHPLRPFLPEGAAILLLGSFPPPRRRWSMEFFYPNFNNDMWRIMGLLFMGDRDALCDTRARKFDMEAVVRLCEGHGIAIYDTVQKAVRLKGNAADSMLRPVVGSDIPGLLEHCPSIRAVCATGGVAFSQLAQMCGTEQIKPGECVGTSLAGRDIRLWRMPSTSRAYPMSLERKAAAYGAMLRAEGILPHTQAAGKPMP